MKKLIALLLALTMVLALAACGGEKEDKGGKSEKNTKPTTEATEPTTEPVTEPTVAPTTEATEPATEPATVPADEADALGAVEGSTYTNEFLGISFNAGDGWVFATAEELASALGFSADALDPENFDDIMSAAGVAMVMYAASADGMTTVNIVLEDLVRSQAQDITEEEYVQLTKDVVTTSMESAGVENLEYESGVLSFAGETHHAVALQGTIEGIDLYEAQVYIKCGDYMASITIASYMENHVEEVLAMFAGI